MKRAGNLFNQICSWENLARAARRARRGKRYRLYAEQFELRRETILGQVRAELLAGTWQPAPMREFTIFDPKERLISAPAYRDRIVHHALCNVIGPILDRTLIAHTYSCRVGLGTRLARQRCRQLVASRRYVLKMDVRHYFPSIDHAILKAKLRRHLKCQPTLALCDRIIDAWQTPGSDPAWFPGDDLLTPAERPRGLPIRALTSQLFANLYLSRMDHLIEEGLRISSCSSGAPPPESCGSRFSGDRAPELQCRGLGYVRYTDDLLIFGDEKRELRAIRERWAHPRFIDLLGGTESAAVRSGAMGIDPDGTAPQRGRCRPSQADCHQSMNRGCARERLLGELAAERLRPHPVRAADDPVSQVYPKRAGAFSGCEGFHVRLVPVCAGVWGE